jgi:hypothetical protein
MIIGISGKIGSGKDTVGKIILYYTFCKRGFGGAKASIEDCVDYLNGKYSPENYVEQISNWQIKKFADKLKDIVCLLIGCTREQLENREFKDKPLGEEWNKWELNYLSWEGGDSDSFSEVYSSKEEAYIHYNYLKENYSKYSASEPKQIILTPRLLLQLLGTEAGRNIIHPDIWVNSLMSEYVISDLGKIKLRTSHKESINIAALQGVYHPNWIITDLRFPNELQAIKDRGGISIRVNRKPFKWIDIESWETETGKKVERVEEHPSETSLDNSTFDYVIDNNSDINSLIEKVKVVLKHLKII